MFGLGRGASYEWFYQVYDACTLAPDVMACDCVFYIYASVVVRRGVAARALYARTRGNTHTNTKQPTHTRARAWHGTRPAPWTDPSK